MKVITPSNIVVIVAFVGVVVLYAIDQAQGAEKLLTGVLGIAGGKSMKTYEAKRANGPG